MTVLTPFWAAYLTLLAFFFGACIGSFLNVCIHRIPLGESVVHPRSHCPGCGHMIAWYDNIPLLSWLALRARCRGCGTRISPRYFLVELLTGILFLWVWNLYGLSGQTLAGWLVVSGLILGTFVDFEHLILPDRVTIGGMILGPLFSMLVPALHGHTTWLGALIQSLLGLAAGFLVLYAIAEIGKLALGRKRETPKEPVALSFAPAAEGTEGPAMQLGGEDWPWEDLFSRASDAWTFDCTSAALAGRELGATTVRLHPEGFAVNGEEHPREDLPGLTAQVASYVFPREAMGFGDVKLMGAIGAFFGWPAVLFVLMLASISGAVTGALLMLIGRREWQGRIPFGPHLALATLVWLLGGRIWWAAYFAWMAGGL